jgi:hypothetical protein
MKTTLTRRQLLAGVALGGVGAGLGARAAQAFSLEPMPAPVSKAYGLACQPASAGSADAQQVVVCPLCGCAVTVTANASS